MTAPTITSATGQCLCGSVRFTATLASTRMHVCHCSMCLRWCGGPSFSIDAESIAFEDASNLVHYASSPWAERGFCGRCGASVFYRLLKTDRYMLQLGSFDDRSKFTIESEIYVDSKPPGYMFVGDHPRLTEAEFLASLEHA